MLYWKEKKDKGKTRHNINVKEFSYYGNGRPCLIPCSHFHIKPSHKSHAKNSFAEWSGMFDDWLK